MVTAFAVTVLLSDVFLARVIRQVLVPLQVPLFESVLALVLLCLFESVPMHSQLEILLWVVSLAVTSVS